MKEFSNLSNVVYKRTYARPLNGGLESYKNTIERVIAGNVKGHNVSEKEIERLKYFMMERKASCAGRGLWFSGSPAHEKLGGVGLANCWVVSGDDWKNLVIAMDLLMLGGGVGMTVEGKYVHQLPKPKKDIVITHQPTKDADFIISDKREGWVGFLRAVLESWFVTGKSFTYSTTCIRGAGELIRGFGGVASGPLPLVRMVDNINSIFIARQGKKLRPIDMADLLCCISAMVVSGNVRRSALILMGDAGDKEFLKAKRWDLGPIPNYRAMANYSVCASDAEEDLHKLFWQTYEQGEPFGIINMPNIRKYGRLGEEAKDDVVCVNPCLPIWATVKTLKGISTIGQTKIGDTIWSGKQWTTVTNKWSTGVKGVFAYITLGGVFYGTPNHRVLSKGEKVEVQHATSIDDETGLTWTILAKRYVSTEEVFDITVDCEEHTFWTSGLIASNCGEAPLESGGCCNLQEIALPNLNGIDEFIEAAQLMTRWGQRVTCETYHWDQSEKVIKDSRRVGTGITGCLQAPNLFNPETLDRVYKEIQKENEAYAKELDIPKSVRTTVIKPSGTLSKVMDVPCEGIHPAYSKYFIQRIRIASNDTLVQKLREAGHHIEPQVKFDGSVDPDTVVCDFYVKTPEGIPCADTGHDTWKQLEDVKMAQKYWADQSISVTVYYQAEDVSKVKDWVTSNLKEIKTVSFLRHTGHQFKQAPKEAITQEQYEKLSKKIEPVQLDKLEEAELVDGAECGGGACPIR